MSPRRIFLFLIPAFLLILIIAALFLISETNPNINLSSLNLSLNQNSLQTRSSYKGYSLKVTNQDVFDKIVEKRMIYTRGAIEPDKNNLKSVNRIVVELSPNELPMIKALNGTTVVSSGEYSVDNGVLNIKINVNSKFVEEDLKAANYYFTRKLLEFLVAVSPKPEVESRESASIPGSISNTTGQDKTLEEINSLEKELFGEQPANSDQKPIVIVKN